METTSQSKYIPTIGVECHVQLKTKTKLFAAVGNDARNAPPNTLISHICVGMPGALPVLNEMAVELAVKAAYALNTKPQRFSKFDRKHYFYPDLPKGYQITQYDQPIIKGGFVEIKVDGEQKRIGITRVNLEEDAGKTIHPQGADYSLVDLNRAGTPLLEIVSEPELHSAAEAKVYARELWLYMKYAGVTDGDLYHGHVRFDINTSLSRDGAKLGTRSEVKNLNSFRSVEAAVAYEIERQSELLDKGQTVIQETRGWDEAKQKTTSQREKEEAHDYRYFPEPDIPPLELTDDYVRRLKESMPLLPHDVRKKLESFGVNQNSKETLLDNEHSLSIFDVAVKDNISEEVLKQLVNLLINDHLMWLNQQKASKSKLSWKILKEALELLNSGRVTRPQLKGMWHYLETGETPSSHMSKAENIYTQLPEDQLESILEDVISQNTEVVNDIKAGHEKAIGFLVGQVMRVSQGKANPQVIQQIIKRKLGL